MQEARHQPYVQMRARTNGFRTCLSPRWAGLSMRQRAGTAQKDKLITAFNVIRAATKLETLPCRTFDPRACYIQSDFMGVASGFVVRLYQLPTTPHAHGERSKEIHQGQHSAGLCLLPLLPNAGPWLTLCSFLLLCTNLAVMFEFRCFGLDGFQCYAYV